MSSLELPGPCVVVYSGVRMSDEPHLFPGQLIEELLASRGWSKRVLAVVLDVDESLLGKIINGKRPVDARLALLLGEVFNQPAERFLALQRAFELAQARLMTKPDPRRSTRAHLFGGLPVAEMIKRGWLDADDVRDVAAVEKSLVSFFQAASLDEIEVLPHAARKTSVSGGATPVQIAWLYRVKEVAEEMVVRSPFTLAAAHEAVARLGELRSSAEAARHVPRVLDEAGIRFVLVESLPSSKIDGVCLWLDDISPVIALSLRHDRIDNFWFVLRHECEHVIHGHGKTAVMLDTEMEGEHGTDLPAEEQVANAAAAEFCVPQAALARFIARKSPFFAERDIIGFARTLRIHPGLVAGQLQRKMKQYNRFRTQLVKIRSIVAPGARVDGWGDVAPVDR